MSAEPSSWGLKKEGMGDPVARYGEVALLEDEEGGLHEVPTSALFANEVLVCRAREEEGPVAVCRPPAGGLDAARLASALRWGAWPVAEFLREHRALDLVLSGTALRSEECALLARLAEYLQAQPRVAPLVAPKPPYEFSYEADLAVLKANRIDLQIIEAIRSTKYIEAGVPPPLAPREAEALETLRRAEASEALTPSFAKAFAAIVQFPAYAWHIRRQSPGPALWRAGVWTTPMFRPAAEGEPAEGEPAEGEPAKGEPAKGETAGCESADAAERRLKEEYAHLWRRQFVSAGRAFLGVLLSAEAAALSGRESPRPLDDPTILTLDELIAWGVPHAPPSVEAAIERLRIFSPVVENLDLSRTFLTGSAVAAALIVTRVEATSPRRAESWQAAYRDYLDTCYPPTMLGYHRVVPFTEARCNRERHKILCRFEDGRLVALRVNRDGGEPCILARGTPRPWADLDLAVLAESDEEFDAIAFGHYQAVVRRHPEARLTKELKGQGYGWAVVDDGPSLESLAFRRIEIYRVRRGFDHLCGHHVGMTCGAYTSIGTSAPRFLVSPRLAASMCSLMSPDYHYFCGRKQSPSEVLGKYSFRGFRPTGEGLCLPTWFSPPADLTKVYYKLHALTAETVNFTLIPPTVFKEYVEFEYLRR